MANRYATKSGNWSDVTVWDGGTTLPQSGDTVRPNAFTVTIDQNITVTELRNDAASPASAGGGFTCSTSRTVNANVTAGSATCLTFSGTTGTTLTLNGTITGGTTGSAYALSVTGTGTVNITGNVIGNSTWAIALLAACTMTVTGNSSTGFQFYVNAMATLSIVGNLTGGGSVNNWGIITYAAATITVTGTVTAGTGAFAAAIYTYSNITSVTVNGNVVASIGSPAIQQDANVAGVYVINGDLIPSTAYPAIRFNASTAVPTLTLNGNIQSASNGCSGFTLCKTLIHASTELSHAYRVNNAGAAGAERKLYTGGVNIGQPGEADVRYATTFGAMDEYTGSLRVPDPSYVSLGVMTDNTTGTLTASLDAAAIRAALGMASADLDTQLDAINAKTINLPSDPASESNVDDAKSYAATAVSNTVAILSKLLKYFQLTLRKDAAIATDNATELAEINADGGSGAGSVDNTADSTQAIASDKDGYKLASDGLDAIDTTAPAGVASNFREMVVQLWRRFHKLVRRNKTTKQIVQYADDNTTPLVTQSYDDTADEEIVGDAS